MNRNPTTATGLITRTASRLASTNATEYQSKIRVYQIVVGFLLASLVWKFRFVPLFYSIYQSVPLCDDFFPALLQSSDFLAVLYLTPILLSASIFLVTHRYWLLVQATVTSLAMFGLCIHQQSYNDVTFTTCFWTSLWGVWYATRINDPIEELKSKAGRLAIVIVSLVFFGGAMGKLTPGYWSGEVFFQIYFANRDFWIFNLLRSIYEPERLREIATYYSRMVIAVEFSCAFLWLLPLRSASLIAIIVLPSIALFSNFALFSVVSCLIGLSAVGLLRPYIAPRRQTQAICQSSPISKLVAE